MLIAILFACASTHDTTPTGGTDTATDTAADADTAGLACTDALQPGDAAADPSGYRYCWGEEPSRGAFFREEAQPCTSDPHENVGVSCDTSDPTSECAEDADCGAGGICGRERGNGSDCACYWPCTSDADCGAGLVCACAVVAEVVPGEVEAVPSYNMCVRADCRTGADCESGECAVSNESCRGAVESLRCRAAWDECRTDADCAGNEQCAWAEGSGSWACESWPACD